MTHHFVFPARAGMILTIHDPELSGWGIPRESGDDPNARIPFHTPSQYSPRERG